MLRSPKFLNLKKISLQNQVEIISKVQSYRVLMPLKIQNVKVVPQPSGSSEFQKVKIREGLYPSPAFSI